MTIVVALKEPGRDRVWFGSDTRCTADDVAYDGEHKWVIGHGWAFGITGRRRLVTICKANTDALFADVVSPYEFTERLRKLLTDHGVTYKADGDFPALAGGEGLLVSTAGVWDIDNLLSVYPHPEGHVAAKGSGERYALGCVFGMSRAREPVRDPEKILCAAIEAACHHITSCGGDVYIDSLSPEFPEPRPFAF